MTLDQASLLFGMAHLTASLIFLRGSSEEVSMPPQCGMVLSHCKALSVFVEFLNLRIRRRRESRSQPVALHQRYSKEDRQDAKPTSPQVER